MDDGILFYIYCSASLTYSMRIIVRRFSIDQVSITDKATLIGPAGVGSALDMQLQIG